MQVIDLSGNAFSGEICLSFLPGRMHHIDVSCNQLSGTFQMEETPESLSDFNVSVNNFAPKAIVDPNYEGGIFIDAGVIEFVDKDGNAIEGLNINPEQSAEDEEEEEKDFEEWESDEYSFIGPNDYDGDVYTDV